LYTAITLTTKFAKDTFISGGKMQVTEKGVSISPDHELKNSIEELKSTLASLYEHPKLLASKESMVTEET
jgi:hypothetical protein